MEWHVPLINSTNPSRSYTDKPPILRQAFHRTTQWSLMSLYLSKCSRLLIFRSPRNSLKYFEMSVPPHIRFAELRKKQTKQPHFTNEYIIRLQKLELYWKYCWKAEKFFLFSTIFCYLLLDFQVKTFSLCDKRFFEISGRDNKSWLYLIWFGLEFNDPAKVTLLQLRCLFLPQKHQYFSYFYMKTCCGYSLEATLWGTSNEYPQHVFMKK